MNKKRILLLSPYDILSHQYWWQGLEKHLDDFDWSILTLPPRYFSWRMRGNSLSWAFMEKDKLEQDYDLVMACSLTDLSALRGFIPALANIPTVVYCHENQFVFPHNPLNQYSEKEAHRLQQQMIQLYTFLCADSIVFNSCYNRDSCLEGIDALLNKLPDHVPRDLVKQLKKKSCVIPIALEEEKTPASKSERFSIVWNHRWEYDKGIERLAMIVDEVIARKLDCQFYILGQGFRKIPETMKAVEQKLKEHKLCGHFGFMKARDDYLKLLAQSHVVLSTSLHEFQGLAVMEAARLGCTPVLPKRLSYPEFFPVSYLYDSVDDNKNIQWEIRSAVTTMETHYQKWQDEKQGDAPANYCKSLPLWQETQAAYHELINSLC